VNLDPAHPFRRASSQADAQRYTRAALLLILVVGAFRLWLCTRYPLSPDEAYYWLWSEHLDWCYFSKGPLVAWTIWLGTHLGGVTEFGVRWPSVLLGAGTGLLLYWLGKTLFSPRIGFWTLFTACWVPIFSFGALVMTIDPLSVFLWMAAMAAGWRAYERDTWGWWLLTGAFIGLGFLAKFTNALQGFCFLLFMVATETGRIRLRSLRAWGGGLIALLLTAPFWIWNSAHGWITLGHLENRGALDRPLQLNPFEFLSFLGLQAVVYSPLLWIGMMVAIVWTWGDISRDMSLRQRWSLGKWRNEGALYLLTMSLPLLAFFGVFAWNDAGQPNWTVPAYGGLLVLLVAQWLPQIDRRPGIRYTAFAAMLLAAIGTLILHDTRWLNLPPNVDPLSRIRGWKQLGEMVHNAMKEENAQFVIAHHYGTAAALTWHMPIPREENRVYTVRDPRRTLNQFDLWDGYAPFIGQNAIFVTQRKKPPGALRDSFRDIRPLTPLFWIEEDGHKASEFRLFFCREFLGYRARFGTNDKQKAP
jgi:4-amino-4-deoxy-L-arabinose transferase-like glycosyltransferase